jgi:cellulose synthase/poly-beta-1,6-N-acetylglucosamine synthase-like glycosyltransferase
VTIVIAAHNEVARIGAKIRNCLGLEYPADKLHLVISLDGPTDGTERAVESFRDEPRLRVVHSDKQRGKAAALNAALPLADGEVVVFADARQRLDEGAIRYLVADLADPSVGVAGGELLLAADDGAGAEGVGLYWRYEKLLRRLESDIHSMLGASGALYAIRRELLSPIPEDTILDDMLIPLRAVLAGKRIVFEPRAQAFDKACHPAREYRRKVRTLAGNYQLLTQLPALLDPRRNPVFLQFVSHKLGRLVVPYFLVLLFASSAFLGLTRGGIYALTFWAQASVYLLALAGSLAAARSDATLSAQPQEARQR